jgi:heme A synthase
VISIFSSVLVCAQSSPRWFTIGSILFTATSVFILWNSFSETLGEDDSELDGYHYRATWIFMIISGVFCTLGELRGRSDADVQYTIGMCCDGDLWCLSTHT